MVFFLRCARNACLVPGILKVQPTSRYMNSPYRVKSSAHTKHIHTHHNHARVQAP